MNDFGIFSALSGSSFALGPGPALSAAHEASVGVSGGWWASGSGPRSCVCAAPLERSVSVGQRGFVVVLIGSISESFSAIRRVRVSRRRLARRERHDLDVVGAHVLADRFVLSCVRCPAS